MQQASNVNSEYHMASENKDTSAAGGNRSSNHNMISASNTLKGDNTESVMEISKRTDNNDQSNFTIQMSQWIKQKEFLKLSNTCQNKEKINHAIEKLLADSTP